MRANVLVYMVVVLQAASIKLVASECDEDGNVLMIGKDFRLKTLLDTNAFLCRNDILPKFVTILASGNFLVDTDEAWGPALVQPRGYFTLVAKEVIQTEGLLDASENVDRGVSRRKRRQTETYRKFWVGAKHGNFLGIALKWTAGQIQLTSTLKPRPCYWRASFEFVDPTVRILVNGKTLSAIKLLEDKDHYEFAYEKELDRDFLEYTATNVFTLERNNGTEGKLFIFGENQFTVQREDVSDTAEEAANCAAIHENKATVYTNGTNVWWLDVEQYYVPDTPTLVSKNLLEGVINKIRNWTFDLNQRPTEMSPTHLLWLTELVDTAVDQLPLEPEIVLYNDLKLIVQNTRKIENQLESELLRRLCSRASVAEGNNRRLLWLYSAAAGHRNRIERQDELITDLARYIEPIETAIKKSEEVTTRNDYLTKISAEYETQTNVQITECMSLVEGTLLPEIKKVQGQLTAEFTSVRNQLLDEIKNGKSNQNILQGNLKNAMGLQIVHAVLAAFNVFSVALNFVEPPIGSIIGTGIGVGTKITKDVVDKIYAQRPVGGYKFPASVKENLAPVTNFIEKKRQHLERKLGIFKEEFAYDVDYIESFKDWHSQTVALANEANQRKKLKEVKRINNEMMAKLQLMTAVYQRSQRRKRQPDFDKKVNDAIINVNNITNLVSDGVKEYFASDDLIQKLQLDIKQIRDEIQSMLEFRDKLYEEIIPMATDMFETLSLASDDMKEESLAAIDVSTWTIKESVKDVKYELTKILASFKAVNDVARSLDKLEGVMATVGVVFERVAQMKEQQRFANLAVGLAKNAAPADPLQEEMQRVMDGATFSNLAEKVTYAFRMWAFPFARVFLKQMSEEVGEFGRPIKDIATNALTQVTAIKEALNLYSTTVNVEVDHHRRNFSFYKGATFDSDPFYVWKWETHKQEILDLLSGKTVGFDANILHFRDDQRHYQKEAFKFGAISLHFAVVNNAAAQKRIGEGLVQFFLSITHMGLNYYHFQGKNYVFRTGVTKFGIDGGDFNEDGKRFEGQTFSMSKYAGGDATLSPYTMWKFTLSKTRETSDWKKLKLLEGEKMNLELIGTGFLVQPHEGQFYTDDTMENYFQPVGDADLHASKRNRFPGTRLRKCRPKQVEEIPHDHVFQDAQGEVHDPLK